MKRVLFLFLTFLTVALLTVLMVACQDDTEADSSLPDASSDSVSDSVTESTAPVTTVDPTLAIQSVMEEDIRRAEVIGDATIEAYGRAFAGAYRLFETYNVDSKKGNGTASVWHYTSFFAMLSRLIDTAEPGSEAEAAYKELYTRVYNSFKYYEGTATHTTYVTTQPITMYGVHRAETKGAARVDGINAVYDDQEWIIRENIYAFQLTGDETYLDEALRLCKICIDGWDYTMNPSTKSEYGGIPWGPGYASKHTCSNAPIVMPLVEIYEILHEQGNANADFYLDWAIRIYKYTRATFENKNHLYGDNVGSFRELQGDRYVTTGLAGGDPKEYTYNTGAMISGACALYRATGEKEYLDYARLSVIAAYNSFRSTNSVRVGRELVRFYPDDTETTWFNLVLLQGFMDYYEVDPNHDEKYVMSFQSAMDYAYDQYLKEGFLPRDYLNGWDSNSNYDKNKNVMDQASASQIYAMLAQWHASRIALLTAEGE